MLTVVLFGFWLAVAIALILRLHIFRASAFKTRTLIGLFLLKLAAGAALIWVYSTIYPNRQTADIFKFFDDAVVINEALTENPGAYIRIMSGMGDTSAACLPYLERTHNWAPQSEQWLEYAQTGNYNYFLSNRLITRIHVLLLPLGGGGIYTHLIFFNFLSLLGIVFFLNAFLVRNALAALAFTLLPSTLLWCSGLLKDNIVFTALCFLFGAWQHVKEDKSRLLHITLIALSSLVLLYTKFYILAGILVYLIVDGLLWKLPRVKGWIISLVLIISALLILLSPLGQPICNILSGKREEALKAAVFGEAQNQVFYHPIDPELPRILAEIPATLANAFFRPLPMEAGTNPLVLLASFENVCILILLITALVFVVKQLFQRNYTAWWFFSVTLAFIIGFTSPVSGGLMRYKTAYIAFLVWMISNAFPTNYQNISLAKHLQKFLMRH